MHDVILWVVLALVAFGGTAVVLTRDPLHQAMVNGGYSVVLAVLFTLFAAPDVALSEIVVGTIVIPTLVLVTISRSGRGRS